MTPFNSKDKNKHLQVFNLEQEALSTTPKNSINILKMNIFEFEEHINLLKTKSRNPFIVDGVNFFETQYIRGIVSWGNGKEAKTHVLQC